MGDGSTQIRPNHSLDVHESVSVAVVVVTVGMGFGVTDVVLSRSSQPNHPGVLHELVGVGEDEVFGIVGAGDAPGLFVLLFDDVVVVGSLHPNHPGVLQVDVVDEVAVNGVVVDEVVVVVGPEVVVSSRHPHQPGVLQVAVRVRECVDVVDFFVVVV